MKEQPVFRAPMRSRDDRVPAGVAVERGLTHGLCGIGGRLRRPPASLADAVQAAAVQLGERPTRRIERFAAAPDGAFVWTRDADGLFWLGRMTSAWRYDGDAEASRVDLVHVRPCTWLPAPVDPAAIPHAVSATFTRGGRNWQQIHDADVSRASEAVWEQGAV